MLSFICGMLSFICTMLILFCGIILLMFRIFAFQNSLYFVRIIASRGERKLLCGIKK
jgi:hypothetical protein